MLRGSAQANAKLKKYVAATRAPLREHEVSSVPVYGYSESSSSQIRSRFVPIALQGGIAIVPYRIESHRVMNSASALGTSEHPYTGTGVLHGIGVRSLSARIEIKRTAQSSELENSNRRRTLCRPEHADHAKHGTNQHMAGTPGFAYEREFEERGCDKLASERACSIARTQWLQSASCAAGLTRHFCDQVHVLLLC